MKNFLAPALKPVLKLPNFTYFIFDASTLGRPLFSNILIFQVHAQIWVLGNIHIHEIFMRPPEKFFLPLRATPLFSYSNNIVKIQ